MTTDVTPRRFRRTKAVLAVLAAIIAAPFVIAWMFAMGGSR